MSRPFVLVLALLLASSVAAADEPAPPEEGQAPPPEDDPRTMDEGNGTTGPPDEEPSEGDDYCPYYEFTGGSPRISVNPILGILQVYPQCITAIIDGPPGV